MVAGDRCRCCELAAKWLPTNRPADKGKWTYTKKDWNGNLPCALQVNASQRQSTNKPPRGESLQPADMVLQAAWSCCLSADTQHAPVLVPRWARLFAECHIFEYHPPPPAHDTNTINPHLGSNTMCSLKVWQASKRGRATVDCMHLVQPTVAE